MIEHGFNYAYSTIKEMTDFFETRGENLQPKENKSKSSAVVRKYKEKTNTKKRKRANSNSSDAESSKSPFVERRPSEKEHIIIDKCFHSTDKCKDIRAMISKYRQKQEKISHHTCKRIQEQKKKQYGERTTEFRGRIDSGDEDKKSISNVAESVDSGEILSSNSKTSLRSDKMGDSIKNTLIFLLMSVKPTLT